MAEPADLAAWVEAVKGHIERCRETGEDPFPGAWTTEDIRARIDALRAESG